MQPVRTNLYITNEGDQRSYARGKGAAYFFCGSTGTTEAIKVRACKALGTLESLGQSFAKDDRHVYLEGRTIKGADPATFERLNALYWRDAKGVGFLERRVPEADPATFQPIDTYFKGRLERKAAYAPMGRDKDTVFERGRIVDIEESELQKGPP